MKTTAGNEETRRNRLQRELADLDSAIEFLNRRKDSDEDARSEYYRLKLLRVWKKAFFDRTFA